MTIKRRFFISNFLMFAVPVVLFCVFAIVMSFAAMGIFGENTIDSFDDEHFFRTKKSILAIDNSLHNDDELLSIVDGIIQSDKRKNVTISVYKSGQSIGTPMLETPLLSTALEQTGEHTLVFDNTAVFVRKMGDYHIVLTDTNFYMDDAPFYYTNFTNMAIIGVSMFVLIVLVIFFTNRILTKIMIRSITVPLNTLSYGVEQIRTGNLTFRLDYLETDEFSPVCSAFNDMANRLQSMSDLTQKEEESRRELIAGISHDLRTPLTAIKLYLEGIEKDIAATPERRQKYFDTIYAKTEVLEHIIGQLFLFSKLETNEFPVNMKSVNIIQTVSEIISGLTEEYAHKGLHLNFKQEITDVKANVDMVLLQRVIVNILENSAKYKTLETGTVCVSIHYDNGNISVCLADDGPGVVTDKLDKLFDVFYRADPARNSKGSGLGLAISAKIMKRMGGEITAEQTTNGGLSIVLRLPTISEERD